MIFTSYYVHYYSHKSFCEAEAFIGYQRDTAAAVVFQATTLHIDHVKEHIDKEAVSTYKH